MPIALLLLGGAGAGIASYIGLEHWFKPDAVTPAAATPNGDINLSRMMMYAAGGIGLVYMARKAKIV